MPAERSAWNRSQRDADKKSRRDRATAGFVICIIALLHSGVAAEPARAGTYVMRNCNVPGHPAAPMHPWVAGEHPGSGAAVVDACATGGGLGFALDDTRRLRGAAQIFVQQPTAPRSQIKFVKAVVWYAARLASFGAPISFVPYYQLPDWTRVYGVTVSPPGSENLVAEQQLSPDAASYWVGIYCGPLDGAAPPAEGCVAADRIPLLVRGMEVTLREDIPPSVSRPSAGTLLESGPQSGVRTLAFSASDAHSGLGKVEVLLGETVVATRDLAPQCPHSDFTVCPASLDETLQVDTRAAIDGSHRLTVRVQDAAGNERTVDTGHVVDVANDATSGADGPLSIKFNGTSRSTLLVSYGRRVSVRGRLAAGAQPVAAGTPVELLERLEGKGQPERSRARVLTEADGSFSVRISTNRPSRTLRLAYRPTADSQVVSRPLKLRVRAAARVRASLRGRLVRFNGRVLSGPVPREGKRVVMEGRSPGSAWTAFKTLRTDRGGGFSGTYRLRVRRPGVRLAIRAVVPRESGYGYVGSRSPATTFRVR